MQEELKITKERIAVLIGEKGASKRKIEKEMGTTIQVNSQEGDIIIEGKDSLNVIITTSIVKAIGRGFNPRKAFLLKNEEYVLDLVQLQDYAGSSKKSEERLRSRIIGTEGNTRKTIELMTNTFLSIYGKTVGIIGKQQDVYLARRAVEIVLNGAPQTHAYMWIRKQKEAEEVL
ncbi:RNA-processing protein [Candidatus Woesearchaeota archaeon]|jgi:ribosomal RNA assembly protein|nr:RNA-processing protein [Candidatus Woesearchaeota archaeon]MBT7237245.1 RNA-processing protein [Candidatus Woesearchaeota archaeon]